MRRITCIVKDEGQGKMKAVKDNENKSINGKIEMAAWEKM